MLPAGQKKQNEALDQDESEDSDAKPTKRNGRRKIKIEYIEDKNRRHITFSKRKAGIMKKAYELSTLTGTQVLLLVVSETGLVYTFTTTKLQPIVTKPEGKNLIQTCLNTPDPTMPDLPETKTEDGGSYNNRSVTAQSSAAELSPQSTSTSSPMMQPLRQPLPSTTASSATAAAPSAPPSTTTTAPSANTSASSGYPQRQQYNNSPPQMAMPPYNQQPRYNGFNGQPNQPYPPQQYAGGGQPSFYQQQGQPYPPQQQGGYWANNQPQQQNTMNPSPHQQRQNIKQEQP